MTTKFCFRCKSNKSILDFSKNKSKKDGLCDYCKKCNLERKRIYRSREYVKLKEKIYHDEYMKKYLQTEHGKKMRWLDAHNKTEERKMSQARSGNKRRSVIKNLPITLTLQEWEEIKFRQNYKCALCGQIKPLTKDHIIPVALGGAFTKENIQGLCKSCNSRKKDRILPISQYANYCGEVSLCPIKY